MGKSSCGVVVASSLMALCLSVAHAQGMSAPGSQVKLTSDRPVYKRGSPTGVKFTLTNGSSQQVAVGPWTIGNGSQPVFEFNLLGMELIAPGQSKSWTWNMKDTGGKLVPAGSYKIEGTVWIGDAYFNRSITVALTPSGKLAGTNPFPLAVGNEWIYVSGPAVGAPGGLPESMKVTKKWGFSGWHTVSNLAGGERRVRLVGAWKPTLYLMVQGLMPFTSPLFRFNLPVGATYAVNMQFIKKLKVGAKNETVVTPAGTFQGCYRLDVVPTSGTAPGFGSFWFAPGVGLVQYSKPMFIGAQVFKLQFAKVTGSDKKSYSFGLQ